MSFPAGAQRRGRESTHTLNAMDPLPGLTAAGDDNHHVMAGLVPAIPIVKSAALQSIEITVTDPRIKSGEVMT